MAKDLDFEARICTSGTNGVALYIPAHIVKVLGLKDHINEKVSCTLDEDGDILVDMESLEDDD